MESEKFKSAMARAAVKTRDEIDALTLAAYWEEFEAWDFAVFDAALTRAVQTCNRLPTVAQIRANRFNVDHVNRYEPRLSYECDLCGDEGLVEVYHPQTYTASKRGDLQVSDLRTVMVGCTCAAGNPHCAQREGTNYRPVIKYDPVCMCPVTTRVPTSQIEELAEFLGKVKC